MSSDEPLALDSGRIILHPQFMLLPELRAVAPLLLKDSERAQALFCYFFWVFSPRSIYKSMPEADRVRRFYQEGKVPVKYIEWLKQTLQDERTVALLNVYCEVVMTPSQRLFLGLVENVERWIKEASKIPGSATEAVLEAAIEKGEMLYESSERIAKMILQEGARKNRGGYEERKFENQHPVNSQMRIAS